MATTLLFSLWNVSRCSLFIKQHAVPFKERDNGVLLHQSQIVRLKSTVIMWGQSWIYDNFAVILSLYKEGAQAVTSFGGSGAFAPYFKNQQFICIPMYVFFAEKKSNSFFLALLGWSNWVSHNYSSYLITTQMMSLGKEDL
jgi:hypothetical protein